MVSLPPADVEMLPTEDLRRLQERRFAVQWDHLWRSSPFYRDKLEEAGFAHSSDVSLKSISSLPFTTKEQIRDSLEASPPLGRHGAVDVTDVRQFHNSSGTTGDPSIVGLTEADAADWTELLRRGYVAVGYTPDDVVVHALSMSQGWVGGVPMVEGLFALGCGVMPLGAESGSDKLIRIMNRVRPTALQATPGFLLHLAGRAEEKGMSPSDLGVTKLLTGGEPGGGIPSVRSTISEAWSGAPVREVMGGTDLACLMWAECASEDGMHFVASDVVFFELVDPETGEPRDIAAEAEGELVYTHLRRDASPVLRFRHRDLVRVLGTGTCACGRTTPRIRCFGRADDMLIVRGVNLFPTAVQDVLADVPGIGPDFRILRPADTHVLPGPVRIRIEEQPGDREVGVGELQRMLRERLNVSFDVEFVPPESLVIDDATKSRFFEMVE